MNCLSRFSRRRRMEAEYYKDIITWLYLHRYRFQETDRLHDDVLPCVFWAGGKTASYFYRSIEIWCSPPSKHEVFTQYFFNVWPTTATLANIETALVECLVQPRVRRAVLLRWGLMRVPHSACWCSMPATANVVQPGHAWRHWTNLINQLDRGWLVDPVNCIYIHVVHWVDMYAVYLATRRL